MEVGEAALDLQVLSQNFKTATIGYVMPVCPPDCPSAWDNWASNERILINFNVGVFLENLSRKIVFFKL